MIRCTTSRADIFGNLARTNATAPAASAVAVSPRNTSKTGWSRLIGWTKFSQQIHAGPARHQRRSSHAAVPSRMKARTFSIRRTRVFRARRRSTDP